jgi:hypothetical protein
MREGHSAATEHTMLHHQHDARSDDAGEAAAIGTALPGAVVHEDHAHDRHAGHSAAISLEVLDFARADVAFIAGPPFLQWFINASTLAHRCRSVLEGPLLCCLALHPLREGGVHSSSVGHGPSPHG